jgi:ceramide glucosyltransferase
VTLHLLWAVPAVVGGCYYAVAIIAALRRKRLPGAVGPGVSILKPVHGWDERLSAAIASHVRLDYPEYELLLGVRDTDIRALEEIRQTQKQFPHAAIRIVPVHTRMPNGKAGSLFDMAAAAKYPLLVINDADICVDRDYLHKVVGPLSDLRIGLVTTLYRATAASFPAQFEALGVAAEFTPSVLVARLLGVAEFALGSTMAVRASDLARIGGFGVIGDYLADDYQLGARITALGLHVAFADTIVETTLGAGNWSEVWRHQVRWSRTVRVSRPSGYYGYIVTQATFWSCVAALAGYWHIAGIVVVTRMAAGVISAAVVLGDYTSAARSWIIPLRDLFGFAVWLTASVGRTVEWRGKRLKLSSDGRILENPPVSID